MHVVAELKKMIVMYVQLNVSSVRESEEEEEQWEEGSFVKIKLK